MDRRLTLVLRMRARQREAGVAASQNEPKRVIVEQSKRGCLNFPPGVIKCSVGDWNEEEGPTPKVFAVESRSNQLPSDLIASSKWEAAWLFDIMKYRNKETKNKGNQERILMEVEWSFGGASEGHRRGVEAKNGCAQLHAYTQSFWWEFTAETPRRRRGKRRLAAKERREHKRPEILSAVGGPDVG